jgi:hypothetical protein
VKRQLNSEGVKSFKKELKPMLSSRNKKRHLEWAMRHHDWTEEQWKKVLFTDEMAVHLVRKSPRQQVWAFSRHDALPQVTLQGGGGKIMVWGGLLGMEVVPLKLVEGTLNAERYLLLLKGHILPFMKQQGVPIVLQQDNAPLHVAKSVLKLFETDWVEVMVWPAQSPDLNPVKNLWRMIKASLMTSRVSNRTQLFSAVDLIYTTNSIVYSLDLVKSMPSRVAAVIANNGGHINK